MPQWTWGGRIRRVCGCWSSRHAKLVRARGGEVPINQIRPGLGTLARGSGGLGAASTDATKSQVTRQLAIGRIHYATSWRRHAELRGAPYDYIEIFHCRARHQAELRHRTLTKHDTHAQAQPQPVLTLSKESLCGGRQSMCVFWSRVPCWTFQFS